jgi:hypothetical protein
LICSKEFTIPVVNEPCVGLEHDAAWTYNPNGNPGQPPAGVNLQYDFEGYHGDWSASRAGGAAVSPVIEWRVNWTSVAGPTLSVRATLIGSVTRVGVGANVVCRANANGNIVTATQFCPPGVTTAVNLDVTATDATLGGATSAQVTHSMSKRKT